MAAVANPTKVITGKVRLSYVHLFQASSSFENQDPKFSTVILIPKTDKVTMKKIKAAQKAALDANLHKFNGSVPKNLKYTLKDGDEDADLEKNPEYEGHYYMSISNKTKPGLVDADMNQILDPSELYSGCYARVSMNAFAYNVSGNRGISFGLNHVQKISDGDSLGGITKPENDFEEIDPEDFDDDDLI